MKQKLITFGGPSRRVSGRMQTAAAVEQRRRRKRTGRHTLHYLLILLAAVAIMAILSLTVFFKIEQIEVEGLTKYAAEEIITATGVKVGDNLFRVSEKRLNNLLTEQFPYIESVRLKRGYPARLTVQITQAKPLGAADTAAGYILIGRSGRILETGVETLPQDVTIVTGMYLSDITAGRMLGTVVTEGEIVLPPEMPAPTDLDAKGKKKSASQLDKEERERRIAAGAAEEESFKMLLYLVDAVTATNFTNITLVDFSDPLNMMVVYQNRVIIELGSRVELDYKLKFVKHVLETDLQEGFEGILDASLAPSSKKLWSDPCDVTKELEKRKLTASAQLAGQQKDAPKTAEGELNPNLTVLPSSSVPAAAAASSAPETASSQPVVDVYAVIPSSASEAAPKAGAPPRD